MKKSCLKLVLDHGTDMQKCKVRVMELRRNVAKLEDSNRNISLQWNRKKNKHTTSMKKDSLKKCVAAVLINLRTSKCQLKCEVWITSLLALSNNILQSMFCLK